MEEAGPGVAAAHCSRGCAFGDFDNEVDLDIVIVNLSEPPSLLRNDVTGDNRWIKFKLRGVKSNRSAIGTRVVVSYGGRRQAQAGFLSVNDKRLHFGLVKVYKVDVEVRWPSGLRQQFPGVGSNLLVTIDEIRGIVARQKPGARRKAAPLSSNRPAFIGHYGSAFKFFLTSACAGSIKALGSRGSIVMRRSITQGRDERRRPREGQGGFYRFHERVPIRVVCGDV